jgi:hypothetical protein
VQKSLAGLLKTEAIKDGVVLGVGFEGRGLTVRL